MLDESVKNLDSKYFAHIHIHTKTSEKQPHLFFCCFFLFLNIFSLSAVNIYFLFFCLLFLVIYKLFFF